MTTPATQIDLALNPAPETAAPAAASIELKGISLPVMHVALSHLEGEQIAAALQARFGKNVGRFFDNDPALIDLARLVSEPATVDWVEVRQQLTAASLQLIGVCGGSEALQASARAAGLAVVEANSVPVPRAAKPVEPEPAVVAEVAPAPAPEPTPEPQPQQAAAMVIDKPLRSGQRIYARGGDLVVLAMVSAGAEVIADGNIHIYAPLRGRALAGAQGDTNARIFTTSFEAELVSVAGVYRTFESPQQFGKLAGQPVQVSLDEQPGAEPTLKVAALSTK